MKALFVLLFVASAAYGQSTLSADVVTNTKTNNVTVTIKGKPVTVKDFASSQVESWRFVHDGSRLILEPFFMGGITYSPFKIVECKTLDIATNEIIKLNLTLTQEQQDSIARLLDPKWMPKLELPKDVEKP